LSAALWPLGGVDGVAMEAGEVEPIGGVGSGFLVVAGLAAAGGVAGLAAAGGVGSVSILAAEAMEAGEAEPSG
jgi:hypothetical protein